MELEVLKCTMLKGLRIKNIAIIRSLNYKDLISSAVTEKKSSYMFSYYSRIIFVIDTQIDN